jgi:hypothetical protein
MTPCSFVEFHQVSTECQWTSTALYGVTFHEIILFIVKFVRTSDSKFYFFSNNPDSVLNMFHCMLFFDAIGTLYEAAIGHDWYQVSRGIKHTDFHSNVIKAHGSDINHCFALQGPERETILYRDGGTCWEITDSATQFQLSLFLSDFTVGITPLSSSNSQTLEPSTPDLSNCRLSISRSRLS